MSTITTRTNPYALLSDFDTLFNSVFKTNSVQVARTAPVNIYEESDRYVIEAEVPGLKQEDLEIRVEDRLLIIQTTNDANSIEAKNNRSFLLQERPNRAFRRSFRLPKDANDEHIEASNTDGILIITIPKTEKSLARTITIKKE
jgi:HSP20 family protein